MKKILLVLICICLVNVSGCTLYKELQAGIEEATIIAEEFCFALAEDDSSNAKSYLSPNYSAPNKEDFEKYVAKLEEFNGIDFSNGIQIIDRSDNGWSGINGEYAYEIIFNTLIGEKEINLFFVVIKNENSYGIFSFGVNPAR